MTQIHSGEKPNKCNQCDFASIQACDLRRHLKTHSGEKSNKCNQCDFASIQAGEKSTNLNPMTLDHKKVTNVYLNEYRCQNLRNQEQRSKLS